jgi:hypothetical protein
VAPQGLLILGGGLLGSHLLLEVLGSGRPDEGRASDHEGQPQADLFHDSDRPEYGLRLTGHIDPIHRIT